MQIESVHLNTQTIKVVSNFKPKSVISPNEETENDANRRIDVGQMPLLQLQNTIWQWNEISLEIKLRLFNLAVRPFSLRAHETSLLEAGDVRRLETSNQ